MPSYHDTAIFLPEICAPRLELLNVIDKAAEKPFIFLQAPAGYGKTVSALLWLKKRNIPFVWLPLDEYDNNLPLFYRLLCQRMLLLVPQNRAVSALVTSPSFSAMPVESTIDFFTLFTWPGERYCIVFDDFQEISSREIAKSLPFVLKRLPPKINVLLISRTSLLGEMSALSGNASLIESSDLAFTPNEIQKHYAGYGHNITANEANDIHSYTDGWIIALNTMVQTGNIMLINEKSSIGKTGKIVAGGGITAGKILLEEFFEKNIWNSLNEERRIFLLKTSIVENFDIELCRHLTGTDNCAEFLWKLTRENIPINRLGDEYRYHNLFLGFLRKKALESTLDIPVLNKLAAEYYIGKNDIIPARQFAVRSGDRDTMIRATRMINLSKNVNLDEYVSLANILKKDQLPDALCDAMPFLYLQKVYVSYLLGKHEELEYYWDKIYGFFPFIMEKFPQFMEANVTNSIIDYRHTFAEYIKRVSSIPAITYKNETDQVSSIGINMPFLHRSSRDCYELTDESLREEVIAVAFRDLLKYDCDNLFLGIEAGLYIEQNRLDEARKTLLRAESLLNEKVSIDLGWATYIMLAETALLKNDQNRYGRYKMLAKDYFESRGAFYYIRNYSAYETRTKLWDGDKNAASQWLNLYFVGDGEYGVLYKIYQNFTTARSHIVLNNCEKALSALDGIRAVAKAFCRPLDAAEADVLTAIVEWISGKKGEARDRLRELLTVLHKYGFIRIVANEGKAVLPILGAVIKKMETEPGKDEAQLRFAREVYLTAYEQSGHFAGLTSGLNTKPVKLSKKQTLILQLLSKGNSNAQIVNITGLSINTIKSYTKIVYQKLDVTNVMDAIVEAKSRGIIK